uniref:Uncharacterized protein n=1 Tax=Anguilla anguilla TaxID=7936 RepID=A0A0E9W4N4_ANGAN
MRGLPRRSTKNSSLRSKGGMARSRLLSEVALQTQQKKKLLLMRRKESSTNPSLASQKQKIFCR